MSPDRLYYVYILLCADGTYYTGVTNDLELRLQQHQDGLNESAYTFSRRPVELKYSRMFYTAMKAIRYEKKIKRWSHAKKKALIDGNWEEVKKLARCRNNSTSKNMWTEK